MNLQITYTISGKNPQPLFVNICNDSTFEKFKNLVSSLTKTKIESIRYEDEDGDLITVESEPEFEEIKKLSTRQNHIKVFIDASPIVVEKPKWGPELISFAAAVPAKPAAIPACETVAKEQLPSTLEALARGAPVMGSPYHRPAPAFRAPVIRPPQTQPAQGLSSKPVHNAFCDHCNATIVGIRYKCANCLDYDLCETCEAENIAKNIHNQQHIFLKIRSQIRSGQFAPLPNLFEFNRGFHPMVTNTHPHAHIACAQRFNALEAKVNALLAQNTKPVVAVAAVPASNPQTAAEKQEERKQKREKAKQEREAKREQRMQLKQKRIQEKQAEKLQKQAQAKEAKQAPVVQQLNLGEIPVVLKVEEIKPAEEEVVVPVKAEVVIDAAVTIEEVEDEFHQQAKEQQPAPVEAKVEEVVVEEKKENWLEIAEEFVKVPKEEKEEEHPYAAQLNILQDMGFSAAAHLSDLLTQFNGDLQAVIQSILEA